jgi:hypothetical protein
VAGGNIPAAVPAFELKMTFKEGGCYDFHSVFERIKERTSHALDMARESGRAVEGEAELGDVHLDELPAYEESAGPGVRVVGEGHDAEEVAAAAASPREESRAEAVNAGSGDAQADTSRNGAPPRYEDVQRESIADALERRVREAEGAGRTSSS